MTMAKKKPTPEGILKRAVMAHLRLKGWFVEINLQMMGMRNGRPDLEASKEGRTIRIETKSPDHWVGNRHYSAGTLRPDQVAYINRLRAVKIKTIVTADFEEFCRELEAIEEEYGMGGTKRLFR